MLLTLTCALAGCTAGQSAPSDASELPQLLGQPLPEGTQLLAGAQTDTAAFWFVHSASPLGVSRSERPTSVESIPSGVLAGLLRQFDIQQELAESDSVERGELREWLLGDGRLRLRGFETTRGWFTLVELFRLTEP